MIIINPAARRTGKYVKMIDQFFCQTPIKYDYKVTSEPGEATVIAQNAVRKKYDMIIAAGGDGTINEVINGIIGTKAVLGIIPLGTINILAQELGISSNFTRSLETLFSGEVKSIDIGKVNDRYFVSMAGFGIDSYAIYRVNRKLKKYLGVLTYIMAGFYSIFHYHRRKIDLNIDDHRIDDTGFFVVIENVSSYAGIFKIAPYADVNDGLLDLCVFKKMGLIHVFRYFLGIALKKHIHYPDVRYYQCKKVVLTSKNNVLVHTDGDLIGSLPAHVTVGNKKLKILVPKND